jgi:hypothetical protein
MEIPDHIKLRLLFQFDETIYKKFYWFEMKGNDFYWGAAYKSARSEQNLTFYDGIKANIIVPDKFFEFPKTHGKYSFHSSGIVHFKSSISNTISILKDRIRWKQKDDIIFPVRFFIVISKTLKHYDATITNPQKNKSFSIIFGLDSEMLNNRMYFEFFLSPEGKFQYPEPLLKMNQNILKFETHSMNKNLILVIAYGLMGKMQI